MIEGDPQRSILLGKLHQRLQYVSNEVSAREASIVHGPENILSVGELSEMRIDPRKAALERSVTYFFYNFRASFIPEQKEVERKIASSIARIRTDRANKALSPKVVVVEEAVIEDLPY